MPETPTFPILPVDRRYLERLGRSRGPHARHIPQADDTGEGDRRRHTAGNTLRRYFRRTFFDPALAPTRPSPSLYDRWPVAVRRVTSLFVAVAVLPFVALALAHFRTDLHPRLCRQRAVTPTDVLKGLAVTRRLVGFGRWLARQVVRRFTAA